MRFFLDENFPKTAAKYLIENNHSVFDVRGTSKEGSADPDLFQMARVKNAIFLTTDKDFFHTIPHLFESHPGVVVVTLRKPNRRNILQKLKWELDNVNLEEFKDKVLLFKDATYAVYEK